MGYQTFARLIWKRDADPQEWVAACRADQNPKLSIFQAIQISNPTDAHLTAQLLTEQIPTDAPDSSTGYNEPVRVRQPASGNDYLSLALEVFKKAGFRTGGQIRSY